MFKKMLAFGSISMSNQIKMLMALYYWITSLTDWHSIVGPLRSRLPSLTQLDFFFGLPVADLLLVRSAGSCELFAYTLLLHCCVGFGSVTQVLEVSVIGETYAYPVGCLGVSGFTYCLWGPYFHRCQSSTLLKLLWSGDAYFGNQDSTYISYLHVFLVQTL